MAQVFVQAFPAQAGKWQISSAGGSFPIWRADGKELFYLAPDGVVMSASVETERTFRSGTPAPLFKAESFKFDPGSDYYMYDVTSDGQRFLFLEPARVAGQEEASITLVQNWPTLLR